jgi:hypothetical protein
MRDALTKSLGNEQKAIEDRFTRAETVLAIAEAARQPSETPRVAPPTQTPAPKASPRPKVLRRTFALTEDEYQLIFAIKKKCNLTGFEAAQSEVVRAALRHLSTLSGDELRELLAQIPKLKPGRTKST